MFKETIIRKLIRDVVQEKMEDAFPKPTDEHTWSGGLVFKMNLRKDKFIHFTTREKAEKILHDGYLKSVDGTSVFAVSYVWGYFREAVLPKNVDELVAIRFTTKTIPKYGFIEEVVWDKNVNLDNATIISYAMGRQLLQQSGSKTFIKPDDRVDYEMKGSMHEEFYHQTTKDSAQRIQKHGFNTSEVWAAPDDQGSYGDYVVEIDAPEPKNPFIMDINQLMYDTNYSYEEAQEIVKKNYELYIKLGGEINPATFDKLREMGYDEIIEDNGDRCFLYPNRLKIIRVYKGEN